MKIRWFDQSVRKAYREAAASALDDAAAFVLDESSKIAPINEGTLINSSSYVVDRSNLIAAIGYNTPYAIIQHERTDFVHKNGRQAKYLEKPLRENAERVKLFIRNRLKKL